MTVVVRTERFTDIELAVPQAELQALCADPSAWLLVLQACLKPADDLSTLASTRKANRCGILFPNPTDKAERYEVQSINTTAVISVMSCIYIYSGSLYANNKLSATSLPTRQSATSSYIAQLSKSHRLKNHTSNTGCVS